MADGRSASQHVFKAAVLSRYQADGKNGQRVRAKTFG